MKRRLLISVGLAALVIPAIVVARGENFLTQGVPTTPQHTVWGTTSSVSTNSDSYKPVAAMAQGGEVSLDLVPPAPLYLSVDMKSGKAQFRLVDEGGDVVNPSSVLFAGKGVSTATFSTVNEGLENPTIEWKRKGNKRVEVKSIVASVSGEQD
jgi:hypothetical protein